MNEHYPQAGVEYGRQCYCGSINDIGIGLLSNKYFDDAICEHNDHKRLLI